MDEVLIDCELPFTVIEVSLIVSTAPPLNLPSGLASTTVPLAEEPLGRMVLPSTETFEASVAVKLSPTELIFDPTALPSLTVNVVPEGTTTGCGAGAGGAAGAAVDVAAPDVSVDGAVADVDVELEPFAAFPPAVSGVAAVLPAELEAVSLGLLEQLTSANSRRIDNTCSVRERMEFPSGYQNWVRPKL